MYACGQRTGDPITSSIHHHILNSDAVRRSSLSFYTSMGSVWQGGCYGSKLSLGAGQNRMFSVGRTGFFGIRNIFGRYLKN